MADIGTVTFRFGGADVSATLRDDLLWEISGIGGNDLEFVSRVVAEIAALPHGPADGFYGPRQLRVLAEAFNGTYEVLPRPPDEDDDRDPVVARVSEYLGVKLPGGGGQIVY